MNNREQAKVSRNGGLNTFLGNNASIYAADNAFISITAKFGADNTLLNASIPATGADNSGFSDDKLNAKNDASESAATLSGSAQVQLESLGMLSIALGLHDAETYYSSVSDAMCAGRLQEAHDLMDANITTLSPDYVTSADLTGLQILINKFNSTQGSSESVHAISPAITIKFKSALKVVDKDVISILKLGKKYKGINIDFYNALIKQCDIPAINIHHTSLHITVKDKTTGQPVTEAVISLSNTTKTATPDSAGFAEIDIIPSGNPMLNIAAPGYEPLLSLTHITSGRENDYTILLTKS